MAITIEFIRGFTSRACQVDPSMQEIVLTSSDGKLLEDIASFLRLEKIKCSVGPVGDRFRLRVRGAIALRTWSDVIGFTDADRSAKLDYIIAELESKRNA